MDIDRCYCSFLDVEEKLILITNPGKVCMEVDITSFPYSPPHTTVPSHRIQGDEIYCRKEIVYRLTIGKPIYYFFRGRYDLEGEIRNGMHLSNKVVVPIKQLWSAV
jgi:hypothetical protein